MREFRVQVVRPVFFRHVIPVKAESQSEAERVALEKSSKWRTERFREAHAYADSAECCYLVVPDDKLDELPEDPAAAGELIAVEHLSDIGAARGKFAYAFLQADPECVEGKLVIPSEVRELGPLALRDLCEDWQADCEEEMDRSFESYMRELAHANGVDPNSPKHQQASREMRGMLHGVRIPDDQQRNIATE